MTVTHDTSTVAVQTSSSIRRKDATWTQRLAALANPNSSNIYVCNLPVDIDIQRLEELVAPAVVQTARILAPSAGSLRSVAFMRFEDRDTAIQCIERLDGLTLPDDNLIRARFADTPQQKRLKQRGPLSREPDHDPASSQPSKVIKTRSSHVNSSMSRRPPSQSKAGLKDEQAAKHTATTSSTHSPHQAQIAYNSSAGLNSPPWYLPGLYDPASSSSLSSSPFASPTQPLIGLPPTEHASTLAQQQHSVSVVPFGASQAHIDNSNAGVWSYSTGGTTYYSGAYATAPKPFDAGSQPYAPWASPVQYAYSTAPFFQHTQPAFYVPSPPPSDPHLFAWHNRAPTPPASMSECAVGSDDNDAVWWHLSPGADAVADSD